MTNAFAANPLYDRLFGHHEQSDLPFLVLPEGGAITYADFLRTAARLAGVFQHFGLQPGDRVAVQVEKSPAALALYAAAVRAGMVFLPLNTAYTPAEMSYFINDSQAAMVVVAPEASAGLEAVLPEMITLLTLDGEGKGSLMDIAQGRSDPPPVTPRSEDDLAALLYTSGTTGRSKGAMLTQGNLLSNAQALVDLWQFTEADTLIHALPIYHVHGLFVASNVMLLAGGKMIFMAGFDSDAVIDAMAEATCLMGVPTFYTRLLSNPRLGVGTTAGMRLFISGSAPLLASTHDAFTARTGHAILERYGMTETGMNTSNPYQGARVAGTVGLPLPGVEVIITDPEDGTPAGRGETGMVEVRGPNVFAGYWGMAEKTAAEKRSNGFFITGDLGFLDDDGYLTIVGRNRDMIISGGFNIYPREIELILDGFDGVKETAVIGVPHPDFGETPVAVIVAEEGQTPDLKEMAHSLSENLARFKHPRHLEIMAALPRNTMGKVQKNILRDQFKTLFTADDQD